ncbi:hypothetical protein BD413DRAFT_462744, partial [Trametes elegans]
QRITWTPEACLLGYQAANDQYWREHGLHMGHSTVTVATPPTSVWSASASTFGPPPAHADAYELLPQRRYVARRRFEPQARIEFKTSDAPYVKLADALAGNIAHLHGRDDRVFSEEHLTQKQSLRLEIVNLKPYERQINVRNTANGFRSITRGRLAEKIARELYDYVNKNQPVSDSRLDSGFFERLVLLELHHVSKSSWQPMLGVLRSLVQ